MAGIKHEAAIEASLHPARTSYVARAGIIAAVYAALTLLCLLFLQGLAWGPVQLRLSEAVTVVAVLTPAAVPGLAIGCVIANLLAIPLAGTGLMGMLDVVFGSLGTLLGALFARRFRNRPMLALLGPVISNALIVPAYLPLLLTGMGYYTIPFTTISIEGAYLPMYLFGVVFTAIGESIVVYSLGLPLLRALRRAHVFSDDDMPGSGMAGGGTPKGSMSGDGAPHAGMPAGKKHGI